MSLLPLIRVIRRHPTSSLSLISRWISSTHTVKEIQIPVPFIKNHIAAKLWQSKTGSHGKAPPPIICTHGWGDSVTSFEPLIPLLLANHPAQSVLAFDFPGHGRSYHTPGAYSDLHMEGLLTILRIIRHFSWDKVTLLGHSFGGLVGLSFASTFPDLVQKFIGIDILPPLIYPTDGVNRMSITGSCMEGILNTEIKILNSAKRPPPTYTRAEMIERMVKGRTPQGGLAPEGCDLLVDRGSKKLPDGKLQFTHDPRHPHFFLLALLSLSNLPTMAEGVTCPTCLISCANSSTGVFDPETLLTCQQVLQNLNANARPFRHEKVEGTHHVHMLQPEVVAPVINEFLSTGAAS